MAVDEIVDVDKLANATKLVDEHDPPFGRTVRVNASPTAGVPVSVTVRLPAVCAGPVGKMVGTVTAVALTLVTAAADATPSPISATAPRQVTPARAATPHRRIDRVLFLIRPPWAF
jgi:hypothetical protein